MTIWANSATMTATVQIDMQGLLNMSQMDMTGTVNLTNGAFDLTETASIDVDLKIASVQLSETFDIGWNPTAGFSVTADLEASAGRVTFDAELSFSVDPSDHVDISGSGTTSVKDLGSASVGFNDDDFYFTLGATKVEIPW
jgi:hypothetical protein